MQYNTPQQERRPTRTDPATPNAPRPRKDYAPKKRKSQLQKVLPLLLLFSALLILIYIVSPKEAGRRVGGSRFDGLVISEVMAANNSAVPDENGEFNDWLELYNGTGTDLDMEGVMITNRTDRITFPFPSYTLKAGERVIDAREEVNVRIPQELREKWQMFLDKQDSYHEWERRMEFDRGFYLAVRIILELLRGGLKL